jgi:mannose-6-phosphate isomerase-like protein (cupin superfamily)
MRTIKMISRVMPMALLPLSVVSAQTASPAPKPLEQRIVRADPSKYIHQTAVHDGPGTMDFRVMLGTDAVEPNLIFFHRGVINPKSGIGEHFHNKCEEMFVILDGKAEFTVDGRTSTIEGPAGVPDRMGHAHAIYNPTDQPLQWLNINVGMNKVYDTFNLGDGRVGAPQDPVPQFVNFRLDRSLLRSVNAMDGGTGTVQYRRALGPTVFTTTWSWLDHLVVPPGSSVGANTKPDFAEVYYVVGGDGSITVGSETASIHSGDVVPVQLNESRAIQNTGSSPLEFLIVGVARDFKAKDAFMAIPPQMMRRPR